MRQKVEKEGGRIRYGWALWEWPHVYIEAEHHAVYKAPDGSWHDITPSPPEDPDTVRVFLPDDAAVYDFDNPGSGRRDNMRHALTQDVQIEEYLRLFAELAEIMRRMPGTGMVTVSGLDAARIETIAKRSLHLKREIAQRYTRQGAPCYCGSGQKFKRCHGLPWKTRP